MHCTNIASQKYHVRVQPASHGRCSLCSSKSCLKHPFSTVCKGWLVILAYIRRCNINAEKLLLPVSLCKTCRQPSLVNPIEAAVCKEWFVIHLSCALENVLAHSRHLRAVDAKAGSCIAWHMHTQRSTAPPAACVPVCASLQCARSRHCRRKHDLQCAPS